ncbi:MAG: phage portal protein [Bacilli bacterium]
MNRKPFCYVLKTGHTVRGDILEQYSIKGKGDESKQIPDTFSESYSGQGLKQPLYNPEALANLLELNTYHYRACKTKARDTAGLGWYLEALTDNPDEKKRKELDEFFSDLNPPLSSVLDRAMLDYESIGYGALELIREDYKPDGKVSNLVHIPAHTLRIHGSGNKFCQIRGNKKRWFKLAEYGKDVDCNTGIEYEMNSLTGERRATEIIWIINYTPRSDYYGLPDIIPAMGAIYGDISRRDYNIAFFDNFGVPAYAVFVSGNFDPGEEDPETGKTPMEESIEEHFKELAKNPHSVMVLSVPSSGGEGEVKIEFKPLSVEIKEASFRLYRQDNRDEILAAHGVPPYRCGIAETGSLGGSTAQESTEIYKMSVIQPRQEVLENLINLYIVWNSFEADGWMFKLAEIDTSDEKHDVDMMSKIFEKGAITPNQIIRHFKDRFGLEESNHPAMNAHYVSGNPIDLDIDLGSDVEKVLKSLYDDILGVVVKNGISGDSPEYKELLDVIGSFKTATRLAGSGRKQTQ